MSEVKRFKMEFQPDGIVRECVYSEDFDRVTAERDAALVDRDYCKRIAAHNKDIGEQLQQRLTAADELADHNARVSAIAVEDVLLLQKRADVLEGLLRTSLVAMSRIYSAGRGFIVGAGSDCDSVELMMENDPTAREIRAALKTAEGGSDEAI